MVLTSGNMALRKDSMSKIWILIIIFLKIVFTFHRFPVRDKINIELFCLLILHIIVFIYLYLYV